MITFLTIIGVTLLSSLILLTALILSVRLGINGRRDIDMLIVLSLVPLVNTFLLLFTFPFVILVVLCWTFNITGDKIDSIFDKLEE